MSYQYIHTSAKRGLEPGKSGFCCVARDRDVPPDLSAELESQSRYTSDSQGGHPLILRHRIVQLRSGTYHILSRINEAGADYSKRNNHLAHHLAFIDSEVASLPNPAAILLNWRGWRDAWDEPPRTLEAFEAFDIQDIESFWAVQSQATPFPRVVHDGKASSFVFSITLQQERQLLEHLRRAINDLPVSQRWARTFTSCLLPTDQPQDYEWAGIVPKLPLPYEIDFTPRALKPRPTQQPTAERPPKPKTNKVPSPKEKEPEPEPEKPKPSIRVEIPEDYDRRKFRRRAKRTIGQRELSRYINLSIVAAALVCALLLYFFLRTRESSPVVNPEHPSLSAGTASLAERKATWEAFAEAGFPKAELARIRPVAAFLNSAGEDTPLQVVTFLETLSNEAPLPSRPTAVPDPLVQRVGNQTYKLPLSPIGYPSVRQLALLPEPLHNEFSNLATTAPARSLSPLAGLADATYSPQSLEDSVDTFLAEANQDFLSLSLRVRNALESYQSQRQAIDSSLQYQPILRIHQPFRLANHVPYLAFDDLGLLIPGAPMSLAQYLRELFLEAVRQSDDLALQSTLFQTYLNRVRSDTSPSALETAEMIYGALATLELAERGRADYWRRIKDQWRDTFVRRDLMEQTILGYTLEALETAKLNLADTRARFAQTDLALLRQSEYRKQHATEATEAARSLTQPKDWIVIPTQPSKVPPSQP